MAIAEGISAIKATLELAKLTSDLVNRGDIDVPKVRANLHEMLIHAVNAQIALGDARLELADLKQKLEEVEKAKKIADNLTFANETYWTRHTAGGLDGPYCPICWDDGHKLIRLKLYGEGEFGDRDGIQRRYDCILHGIMFFLPAGIFAASRTIR
jgi:hypothetical protein